MLSTAATSEKTRFFARTSRKNGCENRSVSPLGKGLKIPHERPAPNNTNCFGCFTGSFRSRSASITLKMAVLAPIPRASERMATPVKAGLRRNIRNANRKSWIRSA